MNWESIETKWTQMTRRVQVGCHAPLEDPGSSDRAEIDEPTAPTAPAAVRRGAEVATPTVE